MSDESKISDERRKQIIDIWKAIVEVQKHFNDISMRIRSMFITILLALFASIGFLLDKDLILRLCDLQIKFATVMPVFGIFATYLCYFMDRFWYHRLLVGAVIHGIEIEKKYKSEIPELSLSDAIKSESSFEPHWAVRWLARIVVTDRKFKETGRLHSDGKIELFYKSVMCVLVLTVILVGSLGGVTREAAISSTAIALDDVDAGLIRPPKASSPDTRSSAGGADAVDAELVRPSVSNPPGDGASQPDALKPPVAEPNVEKPFLNAPP